MGLYVHFPQAPAKNMYIFQSYQKLGKFFFLCLVYILLFFLETHGTDKKDWCPSVSLFNINVRLCFTLNEIRTDWFH